MYDIYSGKERLDNEIVFVCFLYCVLPYSLFLLGDGGYMVSYQSVEDANEMLEHQVPYCTSLVLLDVHSNCSEYRHRNSFNVKIV
jgi:hypothetical protein